MILKTIRFLLGKVILALDALFQPKVLVRTLERQSLVDLETAPWALYQFEACPFCVKVRRAIKRLGLKIELRDAAKNPTFQEELVKGGGELQVPCLRIPQGDGFRWMYESSDIISFLESRFNSPEAWQKAKAPSRQSRPNPGTRVFL